LEITVGETADAFAQVLLLDEAEVVDTGGLRRRDRCRGSLALDVASEHEGDGSSAATALEPDVDAAQVVGVEVELDALAAKSAVDLELEAGQGDLGSAANGAN
jgi:hypothetical protein